MKARPTQSRKGVKGGDFVPFRLPLAGSRDSVPCGVWGNAPTVPRATSMPNALNKGAGSEASLPVTLRSRRSAPELLFPQDSVKNQKVKQAKCAGRRKKSRSSAFLLHEKGEAAYAASPDFAYFSMDSSQESNGLMPSRPATVGATFARPKPWPSFSS